MVPVWHKDNCDRCGKPKQHMEQPDDENRPWYERRGNDDGFQCGNWRGIRGYTEKLQLYPEPRFQPNRNDKIHTAGCYAGIRSGIGFDTDVHGAGWHNVDGFDYCNNHGFQRRQAERHKRNDYGQRCNHHGVERNTEDLYAETERNKQSNGYVAVHTARIKSGYKNLDRFCTKLDGGVWHDMERFCITCVRLLCRNVKSGYCGYCNGKLDSICKLCNFSRSHILCCVLQLER